MTDKWGEGMLIQKHNFGIEVEEVDVSGSIACGFRQDWLKGKGNGIEFELLSGAGLGSPWIIVDIKKGKQTRHFRFDVRELAKLVADRAIDTWPKNKRKRKVS